MANARPSSTRAAGAGGSSSTMLSECDVFFWWGMWVRGLGERGFGRGGEGREGGSG